MILPVGNREKANDWSLGHTMHLEIFFCFDKVQIRASVLVQSSYPPSLFPKEKEEEKKNTCSCNGFVKEEGKESDQHVTFIL